MNISEIVSKLMAVLPTVEADSTEIIELATAVKSAAQDVGAWTADHEAVLQNAVNIVSPPKAVPTPTPGPAAALIAFLAVLGILFTMPVKAQTNTPVITIPTISTNPVIELPFDKALKDIIGNGITNGSVDLYGTYAPKAPVKFGGGIFLAYNFNNYVAAGVEGDWLGQFSLVSANLQLQAPFHLTTILPILDRWSLTKQIIIVPVVIGGPAIPYSGNGKFNGAPMVVADVGGGIQYGHLWGGQFNSGVVWGKWIGQGPYAVERYHAFAGWGIGLADGSGPSMATHTQRTLMSFRNAIDYSYRYR